MHNDMDQLPGEYEYMKDEFTMAIKKSPYLADEESFLLHAKVAKSQGKEVLVATDDQLFLDLDFKSKSTLETMFNGGKHRVTDLLEVLADNDVNIVSKEFTRSSSGNFHGIINLDTSFNEPSRIALEVALGSDPKRAILSVLRYAHGIRGVSRLFRPLPLTKITI